jgi:hypothetical protein
MSDQAVVRVRDALEELQATYQYHALSHNLSDGFPTFQRDFDALVLRCL